MRVDWKVPRLTKILSKNVTKWGLFFNIIPLLVYTLFPLMLQFLDPIGQKSHQQQIWCLNFWDEAWLFLSLRVFRTIVFIFIIISTTFPTICSPAFFRYLSNSGTFTELQTTSFKNIKFISPKNSLWIVQQDTWHNGYRHWFPKLLKKTIIGRLQVQSWLQASNDTGILNTCTQLWNIRNQNRWPPWIQ